MSENLATIAREARQTNQSLKDLLKSRDPYDREVEGLRKTLRKHYLALLLLHPNAKESKDVEIHIWMQTSYAFISSYKQRITSIDRAIQGNARQTENPKQGQHPKQQNNHGPVEHRKLLMRFRQFLAEEEKFWIQLLLRMRRSFDLHEADYALATLGFMSDATTAPDGQPIPNSVFPDELLSSSGPTHEEERRYYLSLMSKALICLGDLARYRELYNESGGRPRAGHEAGTPARRGKVRKRGAPGLEAASMARNYDKAQQRYEQARLLLPDEGNASHQLAIVASYVPDALVALTHYYRALCVKQPFEPASENMAIHLTKTLQLWHRNKHERERISGSPPIPIPKQVDIFKNRTVILHALWRKGSERDVKEQGVKVYEEFHRLLGQRNLPPDTICNIVITSQGALWKYRMIRDSKAKEDTRSPEASAILEWQICRHLLDMHIAMLEVGKEELKDVPSMENIGNDLAQRITATFRRTLPAMRIASKWLRANLGYLTQDPEFKAFQHKERSKGAALPQKGQGKISKYSNYTVRFWKRYSLFMTALGQAFPEAQLTLMSHPLEEDIDMRGFLPLKKSMGEGVSVKAIQSAEAHPNEEQLMRISDLLFDAKAIVNEENSPLTFKDGVYSLKESVLESRGRPHENGHGNFGKTSVTPQKSTMEDIRNSKPHTQPKEDDAMTEATSRTDDDIVNDAFKHLGEDAMIEDDDDDEEQIVWNPKASSPALSPLVHATSITAVQSLGPIGHHGTTSPPHASMSPKQPAVQTPIGSPRARATTVSSMTAQDLLQSVLSVGRKPGAGLVPAPRDSPAKQPALLFGSELTHQPITHSIWAASHNEGLLKYGGSPAVSQIPLGAHTSPRIFPQTINPSNDLAQTHSSAASIWSSQPTNINPATSLQSYGSTNASHQHSFPSTHHGVSNGLGLTTSGVPNQHHRVSSNPMFAPSSSQQHYGGPNFQDPAIQAASFNSATHTQPQSSQHQPQFASTNHASSQPLLFQSLQQQHQHRFQPLEMNGNRPPPFLQQSMSQDGLNGRDGSSIHNGRSVGPQSFGMATPQNPHLWGKIA